MTEHISVNKSGDIDFPLWIRAIGWFLGIAAPIALGGGVWMASAIFDISVRMARIEASIVTATEDRYRASQADDAHDALEAKMDVHASQIKELQSLHGRN